MASPGEQSSLTIDNEEAQALMNEPMAAEDEAFYEDENERPQNYDIDIIDVSDDERMKPIFPSSERILSDEPEMKQVSWSEMLHY